MTSSQTKPKTRAKESPVIDVAGLQIPERDLYAARFIDKVVREIRRVVDQKKNQGITLTEIAHCINVDKGQLSRQLSGSRNITLRTVGEIAWALGKRATFTLESRPQESNHLITQAVTSTIPMEQSLYEHSTNSKSDEIRHVRKKFAVLSNRINDQHDQSEIVTL